MPSVDATYFCCGAVGNADGDDERRRDRWTSWEEGAAKLRVVTGAARFYDIKARLVKKCKVHFFTITTIHATPLKGQKIRNYSPKVESMEDTRRNTCHVP